MSGHSSIILAREVRRAFQPPSGVGGPFQRGVVASPVTPGAGVVSVYLDNNTGTATPNVHFVDSYSPVAGDNVVIGRFPGTSRTNRIILGSIGEPGLLTYSLSTWTTSGSAASIGNGTCQYRYRVVGKLCTVMFTLLLGSTTFAGTGTYQFPLPPGITTADYEQELSAKCFVYSADGGGTPRTYSGFGFLPANNTVVLPYMPVSSSVSYVSQVNQGLATAGVPQAPPGLYPFDGATYNLQMWGTFEIQ